MPIQILIVFCTQLIFIKNNSNNYIDSFIATNLNFAPLYTRIYNTASNTYVLNIDTFMFPEITVNYNVNGNLANLLLGVNACDGYLPGDDYSFYYNVDGSMDYYDRRIYLARCGDYNDTARFVYLNDTVLFNNGDIRYCNTTDTLIYLKDNLHVSTIPLFYHARNNFVQGCGGNFLGGGISEFFKFGSKNMPLINEIKIGGDRLYYVVKYSYLFNGNNDVSQMIMNLYSRLPE